MFRCAGVVLVLASLFLAQEVQGDPALDAFGIIQGYVWAEPIEDSTELEDVMVSVEVDDTTLTDQTDSQGRYTLSIPLHDEDSLKVSVHADLGRYIAADSDSFYVKFGQVYLLDFILRKQAQIIYGLVKDLVFDTGIESVYVFMGDSARSTHTNNSGRYWLEGLDAGTYDISFNHPDFLPETTTVTIVIPDPPDPPLAIRLDETLEQIIWHVDDILGDDDEGEGDGRVLSPFATIKKGIEFVTEGDTVLVEPGIYTGSMNTEIIINGLYDPEFTLKSSERAEVTTIRCEPDPQERGIKFSYVGPLTVLDGFTFTNGFNTDGGAINCFQSASPTIRNCIFANNGAGSYGGAMNIDRQSDPMISHCVFRGNYAAYGGAIAIFRDSSPTIDSCIMYDNYTNSSLGGAIYIEINDDVSIPLLRNCTLTRNSAVGSGAAGGGIYFEPSDGAISAVIKKSIIWGNDPNGIYSPDSYPVVDSCDVQDSIWTANDNISEHPLFCDPAADDFHLGINSPCDDFLLSGQYIGALGTCDDSVSIIFGWVTDAATLDSIEGVSVEAICLNSPDDEADTDSDGYYELVFLTTGTDMADVSFSHPAYIDITVEDVVFTTGYSTELSVEMTSGCEYIPGDVNFNDVPLELADVLAMVANYRGEEPPYFVCACPPNGDYFAATADPNGNCIAMELADVNYEIAAYRGDVIAYGCSDCPGAGPPPPGACCIGLDCLFTLTRQECEALGGDWHWHYFQTCPEYVCSTVLAPPAGASAVPSLKSKVKIDRGGLTR